MCSVQLTPAQIRIVPDYAVPAWETILPYLDEENTALHESTPIL